MLAQADGGLSRIPACTDCFLQNLEKAVELPERDLRKQSGLHPAGMARSPP